MSFSPSRFADLGKQLARDGNYGSAPRARTCYSRAYYALFLALRSAIRRAEGEATHGRGDHVDHGALTDVLFSSDNPEHKALGKTLDNLYTARRKADYVLDPESPWDERIHKAENARIHAKQAQAAIRKLPKTDFSTLAGQLG